MFFLRGITMIHALPTPATRLRVIVWSQAPGQSDVRSHRDHPASDMSMVQLRCQNCPILPLGKTTVTESISQKTWKCRFFPILSQTGLLFERFQELPRSTAQCVGFPDPMQEWRRTVPGSSWAKSYDSILRRVSPSVLGIPRPQTIYSEHIRTIYNPSVEGCTVILSPQGPTYTVQDSNQSSKHFFLVATPFLITRPVG